MVNETRGTRNPNRKGGTWGWAIGIIVAIIVVWGAVAIWGDEEGVPEVAGENIPGEVDAGGFAEDEAVVPGEPADDTLTADEELAEDQPLNDEVGEMGAGAGAMAVITEESDLEENSAAWIGREVQVTGEVNEIYGERLFALDYDGVAGGDELIVSVPQGAQGSQGLIEQGRQVMVRGTVQSFDFAAIQEEHNVDMDVFDRDPQDIDLMIEAQELGTAVVGE